VKSAVQASKPTEPTVERMAQKQFKRWCREAKILCENGQVLENNLNAQIEERKNGQKCCRIAKKTVDRGLVRKNAQIADGIKAGRLETIRETNANEDG
jgi:hypothetical protein